MSFQLLQSRQLMENHVPADVLDAQEGFSTFQTPAGAIVVLGIGNDRILRVSVEMAGTATGWTTVDLSTDLEVDIRTLYGNDATYAARTFAASMDSTTGTLACTLAVTVTSNAYTADAVFALAGPPGTDPSVWLPDQTRRCWTSLPFTPANLPSALQSLTRTGPSVEKLYLETGIGTTAPAAALALVKDPALAGVQDVFVLDVAGGPGSWSYSLQEHTLGGLEGLDEGRMRYTPSWGIYKLYALDGTPSLTFLPLKAAFGPGPGTPTTFAVPPTASAIASLVHQPVPGETLSELFVAVDGSILCYPNDAAQGSAGLAVIQSQLVVGVTQLHAVNAGDTAFLWGVNGSGTLFYTRAPLAEAAQAGAWSAPVPLLSGVTAASAVVGAPENECGVCALAPVSAGVTTGPARSGPTLLALNPITGHWGTTVLPMPSTGDCITLKTYTTRVQLYDGNAPLAGTAVKASASIDSMVIVNGLASPLSAGTALDLTTDMSGSLNFIHPVSSLAGATYTFTLPDGTAEVVHAASDIAAKLGSLDPMTLSTASYKAADGTTASLVPTGTSPATVSSVASAAATLATRSTTLPPASGAPLAQRRARARTLVTASSDGSLFMDLGDLVQFVGHTAVEVENLVLDTLEESVRIVVQVGEELFSAVVQTAEDALHALVAVFKWIGAEFEAVFRWLAFLFDWPDIVAVHRQLADAYQQILGGMKADLPALVSTVTDYLAHVKQDVLATFQPATAFASLSSAATPTAAYNAQAPAPPALNGVNLQSDARIGWVHDRASTPPSSSNSMRTAVSTIPAVTADVPSDLDAALATLLQSVELLYQSLAGDLVSLVEGNLSPRQFLTNVISQVAVAGVDDLDAVATAMGAAASDTVSLLLDALTAEIDIPILSALYRAATGDELSVLDLICLIQAIVFTIAYKIIADRSPIADLQALLSNASPASTPADTLELAPNPPVSPVSFTEVGTQSTQAPVEGASPLEVVTGCLLIVQGVGVFALGLAKLSGNKQLTLITYTLDLLTRTIRGHLEMEATTPRKFAGQSLVKWEYRFDLFMIGGISGQLASTFRPGERAGGGAGGHGTSGAGADAGGARGSLTTQLDVTTLFMILDALLSLGWGIWEVRNMCADEVDNDADHILETAVELAEPPTLFCCILAHDKPNPETILAAFTFSSLRSMAAAGAGIIRATQARTGCSPEREQPVPVTALLSESGANRFGGA